MIDTLPTGSSAVLADTGPLYAATDPKDQYHARARQDLQRLARQRRQVFVPYPILCECHSLAIKRLGAARALDWLKEVQGQATLVVPTAEDYVIALRRPLGYRGQDITLADAMLAVMSDRLGLPVWTFDHHFDVMGSTVWR